MRTADSTGADKFVVTNAGNVGIGTTNPSYALNVAGSANLTTGNAYYINGASVLNATTLGTGVLTSSLTTVGALNSGSITSGFGAIDVGDDAITTTGTGYFGTLDLGTNTITDGSLTGNWAFNSGNLSGIGT
ncbi:hypothetical protein COV27_01150, partial [candidate division WWE3 bacterium CG10_big_fil_rev_8_21_14_0_10_39_14]